MTLQQINIDEGTATLAAAVIAAVFSLLTLLATKPTEIRTANRKTLENYIADISDSIHQLIAISHILLKNKTEESRENWRERAESAKEKFKEIRPKIRYSLWGIDEYLLVLARLPDYTLYTLEDIETANKVVRRGSRLGDAIDNCVRKCYLNGRTPRFYERWAIQFYSWQFTKARNDYRAQRRAVE